MSTIPIEMPTERRTAYLSLSFGVFAISWSAILVHWTDVPGPVSAFWRVALAGLVLLIWSGLARPRLLNWRQLSWAACGGVFFAADLALFNTAATHANASNVTVLGNSTPIFAGLLSWWIWKRRPGLRLWIGLSCAATGAIVLAGGDALLSAQFGSADLMALTASLCFAFYLMATERVRSETGTLPFLTAALLATSLTLLLFNSVVGLSLFPRSPQSWAAVIGLALLPQLLGYLAITYSLGHLSATTVSMGLTGQIPGTAILAAFLFHERMLPHQIVGSLLILVAIWVTLGRDRS